MGGVSASDNPYAAPEVSSAEAQGDPDVVRTELPPIDLLVEAREMIGDQYWVLLGVTTVAMLVAILVPFGVVLGPAFCGMYACFLERADGKTTSFSTLGRFTDHLGPAFGVGFAMLLGMMATVFPSGIVFAIVLGITGENINIGIPILYLTWFSFVIVVGAIFSFAFQLVVDQRCGAIEAIGRSARATWANFGQVMRLNVVYGLTMLLLTVCFYVPMFFFLPLAFGVYTLAYRRVFSRGGSALP